MKIKTKTATVLVMAIVITGCGSDMVETQPGTDMVPVEVSDVLSVGADISISRASSAITTNGAKIGVFRAANTGYTAQDNVLFTYSSSSGKWTATTNPILVGDQAAVLSAYYPYGSATISGETATLDAQKYDSAKDLSYATTSSNTVTNQNPNANFAMKHAYARIKMSIKRHTTNYSGNCNVSTVTLKNNTNFYASKTLNIKTGSYGGSAASGGWTYTLNTGNMGAGATNSAYDVLIPPQPVNSGLTITLTVDGVDRSVTISAASFSSNLNAGSEYSISLVLTDTEVSPNGSVNIADWATDNTSIGGDVTV